MIRAASILTLVLAGGAALAGPGDGLVITRSNANNVGTALVVTPQTPTTDAINVTKGKVRESFGGGASALATPVACARFNNITGSLVSSSGNVSVQKTSPTRFTITVTSDTFPENRVTNTTIMYKQAPSPNGKVATLQPNDHGVFQIDSA
jgi:hypothetical protein